ncbi:hypothetical protein Tco_0478464 [Tanacetum coccineum]
MFISEYEEDLLRKLFGVGFEEPEHDMCIGYRRVNSQWNPKRRAIQSVNWDGKIYCCKRIFPKVTELNSKAQLGLAYFVDKAQDPVTRIDVCYLPPVNGIPLPGLTFAIYRLLMGNSDLIGVDGWTSSLAEVPIIRGNNGNIGSSP